jgi:hypothetical protein
MRGAGDDRRDGPAGLRPGIAGAVEFSLLAAWVDEPEPTEEEVAAIVAAVTVLDVAGIARPAEQAPPSRWARVARREAVRRLGAGPRDEDGWRGGMAGDG